MAKQPTIQEIDSQLLRLSRSRAGGQQLTAKVAALRLVRRRLETESKAKPDPGADLTPEQRRSWLELDLLQTMQVNLGWPTTEHDTPRVRLLEAEADEIVASGDVDAVEQCLSDWRELNQPARA